MQERGKKIKRFFTVLVLLSVSVQLFSQCPNDNILWVDLTPTGVGNTQTTTCIWGGEYATASVCEGASYTFQTCGSSWDTFITLYNSAGGGALAWNDDACGLQSIVTWTATFTGTVNIVVDYWTCTNFSSCAILSVTQNTGCATGGGGDNYNMPGGTITTCGALFYDTGGPGGNYGNNQNITTTFCPDGPDQCIQVSFTSFSIENGWDYLYIYDGPNTGSPIIGVFSGTNSPGMLTATSGCLTFRFTSDGSVTFPGWAAAISCTPCDSGGGGTFEVGCPEIDLGPDIALPECYDPCLPLELEAQVFETGLTTSYTVESIPFNPQYSFNAGTQFSINTDDVWTGLIDLPFNFCFYGNTYSQCVVGSNGLMSFNAGYANGFCPWAFNATCPSAALPLNSIFGVYHDIDPSVCGTARYAILGEAPCRVFVVNFSGVCHFSCNSLISTTQIVLYETTNAIDVYVQDKPTCNSWNSGNALIGLQNAAGNQGITPPGRNTAPWTTNNEAWRFIPSGAPNFEVNWYSQNDGYIGSGLTIDVCPSEPTQSFVAEAVYTRCDGSTIVVDDIVTVSCLMVLLPVEWLDFQATLIYDERATLCEWSTGSETNNDFFSIERSADGVEWAEIGQLPGSGTTTSSRSYQWVDRNPLSGRSYYRIKQTDYNGEFDYSVIRSVERKPSVEFGVYPNPSSGVFTLTGYHDGDLLVFDVSGRRVPFTLTMNGELTIHHASSGLYFFELVRFPGAIPERLRVMVQ